MKKLIPVMLLAVAGLSACEKAGGPAAQPALSGAWVEESQRRDTLVFDPAQKWFSLHPVLQIPGQPWRPTGLYQFELTQDSIRLRWMPASIAPRRTPAYYFQMNTAGNKFTIGNFMLWPSPGQTTLTFRQVP